MLHLYGTPLSTCTNKVIYLANFLKIPFEFHLVNLGNGEHLTPDFLQLNPYGKVPAINDNGFKLAESNTIMRYLAEKQSASSYPSDLNQRTLVNQWLDYISQHVAIEMSKMMFNTYFCKLMSIPSNERALQEGHYFLSQYLPVIEKQLSNNAYIAGENMTLADFALVATLEVCELIKVDLSVYPNLTQWRNKMMSQDFYRDHHKSYTETFNNILGAVFAADAVTA